MPRNVSKIAKRLSKWRADTCQALSRAACGDTLADAVRAILRKTANIFKKIRDDAFDEEQRGQVSRELVTILCQVSSNLYFRARDLLPAVESVGAATRFDYWDNQCAILSYVLDLALVLNEPSAVAKVLFTLSKNKHRVWDVLVQTEAIASTAALDERDKVLDVFRWLAAYCPRTCSNPELYFKFIACAACLARRLHERGWKTVKPTALTIEPAEFDFEEWFAAQPALVVLLPPSADPRPRRKMIAQLCKSASSHEELLKACEAISESGGGRESNIRSACDAEATTEDDFFTIVDDGLEAREHATAAPQVEDQQLQVILESTLNRIHSSLASSCMTDSEVNLELISEAILSPLNTRAFLDKLLSGTSVGHTTSAALDGVQKSGNLLEKDRRHNGRAADKGDGSRGGTQEVAASEDESCVKATPDPVDSAHEIRTQSQKKKVLHRNASRGETASSVTETAQECGAPSAITVDSEKGEASGLQLSGRKHVDKVRSLSAAEILDATTQRVDEQTPLKRAKQYSSTDKSPEKQMRDQETAEVGGKLPPLRERRDAPQDSSSSQVRPIAEKVKAVFVQRDSSHVVVRPSLQESKGKLKGQSDSENEAVVVAVANRRSKIYRARKKAEECCIIDSSEEELSHEECLEESRARLPSDDANGIVLSPGEESECGGPGSGSEGAGSEVRSPAGAVNTASSQQSRVYSAGEVASAKATGNLESQSGSEVELGTEAVSRHSSKGRGLRKACQRIIKHSSEEESCSEQNVEKDDMRSASDNADETTSNVGTEPPGKAQSSGSDSKSPGLQARRAKKLVKAASMRHQSSRIASTVSPEGCGKSGGLSSSDEGASAEEAVSARSRKVCGARKARRHRISDCSEDKSCSEQNLEDGVNLAFDDDVEMHSVKGAGSVRGVPSSSSDPESVSDGSPSTSIKKRTATLLASGRGAASVGCKVVRKLDKPSRSRISSSSEEESQVKHVSKGSAERSTPRRAEEHEASSGSECELPKESLDEQGATRSSIRKSVTATPSLASNGRAALSSPNLRRTVSRASKEQRNRIGELSQHEPCTSPISKGDYKTSGVKCTCSLEASSGSESDLPLSQKAPSQSVNKVHRSRIVSSSELSDGEHGAEVSVQPDTACREVPSESDDDKIPCGQRPPSTSSSSECTHFSSSDSEPEEGPHSQKLPHKRHLATESEADTVDMLSGDEEGLSEKRSCARLSEATTVAASPERRSASPFPQARAAQTSRNGCQAENDADTGATQGSAENSVFKLPTLKRARTVSAHREVGSKSQDEHGGLDKRVSGSSPLERSAKGETYPVTNTTLTGRTLRSRSPELSQDENLRQSDQEGFAELASGDTGLSASHKATASTSLNCSIPALEGMPSVHSDSVSSNRVKTSIREESSDALHLHNVHTDANEAAAFGRSASQNSLKTEQEQTVARESPQVNGRRRTSPRKRTTSGPSCLEAAMHQASSECDADVTCSSKERSVLNTQAQQCSSTKSRRGAQVSLPQSSGVSDDDIELELPQKHLCTLSNEKHGSPVTRRELGAHSEESSAGRSEQAGPDNLQKNLPSPGKHDSPAKLLVRTRSTRRQLLANASASLSPRNKVADCMRAVGSGKAPDTLEQTSSSEQGDITDDSSEQESPRKRPSSQAASSKEKKTLSRTRKKSGTSLEAARTCRSEQLAPSKQKSPSSLVKDDIPATVLTRSARKRLSTNTEASVSLEKNMTAKSTRAKRPDKATDTIDAASAWEKLRNISEEILDSDAESGMSSLIDNSPSLLTDLSSAAQKKRSILVEKRLGEHKVVSESKRHSTRLCASQTGLCTASQLRLRSTKNDAEAVVPVTSSQESSKGNLDSSGVQNESIARSSAMHEHPKQCCIQDLSQSSSKLDGLTQAPLSPRLRQREAGASQLSQRELGQLGKKGCAVNASEALSSSFVSLGEDSGDETSSVAESRGLSPLFKSNDSPTAPKLDSVYHGAQGSGTRKSGRLSLTAIRSSQSEASEDPKSAPSVNNRRAVTNGAIEQPTLSTATRTRSSSSAHASSPDSKKQASGAKKRPTRTSASLGSQDYRAAEAVVSLSQQVVDAAYIKESSAEVPATRRSARLSLRRSSLGSQASSSLLMTVAQEERNSSDDEGDRRLTRSHSVRTTPSSKDYDAADPRTPPVRVVLDRLQDVSKTGQRSKDACSAYQRSSPVTQNSGTMTDESYLHDEADFSNLSTSTKRRRTDRRNVAASSQQKTTTSTRRLRQCSMGSPQTSAPVRRSTRTAANVSRRLSYV